MQHGRGDAQNVVGLKRLVAMGKTQRSDQAPIIGALNTTRSHDAPRLNSMSANGLLRAA